jgi:hypothetical protein
VALTPLVGQLELVQLVVALTPLVGQLVQVQLELVQLVVALTPLVGQLVQVLAAPQTRQQIIKALER